MWRILLVLAIVVLGVLGGMQWHAQGQTGWRKIAANVELREFSTSDSGMGVKVIAVRTKPSQVGIAVGKARLAREWRLSQKAIVATNGGYFDARGLSLGLRAHRGRRLAAIHGTKWPIFYVRGNRAGIVTPEEYKTVRLQGVDEAVQCGPALVRSGQVGSFKAQWAQRTGLGIQKDGSVVLAIAEGHLSLKSWAALWAARDGLNCPNAINLDGGSSTQLSLKSDARSIEVRSDRAVPDAIVIRSDSD